MPIPVVCLIGVTGFAAVHLRDIREQAARGLVRLAAVTAVNPGECAALLEELRAEGVEIFDTHTAMLGAWRGRADLCSIPTGHHWHRKMTEDALAAGMHVFVEKPAAATAQDVRAMDAAARAAGRWVAVGFQSIYASELLDVKQILLSGRLGRVESVKVYGLWRRADGYYARNDWAGRLRLPDGRWVLDSPFNNALAHYLNVALWLASPRMFSPVEPARVEAELYRARGISSADTAALRVTPRAGAPVMAWFSHVHDGENDHEGPMAEVRCSAGRVLWALDRVVMEADDGERVEWPGDYAADRRRPLRADLVDRLRMRMVEPDAFVCTLKHAMAHTAVVNAAHDATAVHDFPAALVDTAPGPDGDAYRRVRGLAALTRRAFAEEKLFAELGVDWARGGVADAGGYMDGTADFPANPERPDLA